MLFFNEDTFYLETRKNDRIRKKFDAKTMVKHKNCGCKFCGCISLETEESYLCVGCSSNFCKNCFNFIYEHYGDISEKLKIKKCVLCTTEKKDEMYDIIFQKVTRKKMSNIQNIIFVE